MLPQKINIPSCDWNVDILYDARPHDADMILSMLWRMGCAQRHMYKAEDLLKSGIPNQGLTYSDKYSRHTLIVIGHASDVFECINSISHEVNHLEAHICEHFSIDMHSEEAAYLSGEIKEIIARSAWAAARRIFLSLP